VDARNRATANCIYVRKSFDPTDKHLGKYVIFNATLRYKTLGGKDSLWEFLSFDGVSDLRLWE